jgi:hypothetical protein
MMSRATLLNPIAYAPTRSSTWTPPLGNRATTPTRKRSESSVPSRDVIPLRPTLAAAADVPRDDALRHWRSDARRTKEQLVEVVRSSLLSSDSYGAAYERNIGNFKELVRRQRSFPEETAVSATVEAMKPVLMADIDARFGTGWLEAIRVAEIQLDEALRLLGEVIFRIPIKARHRGVDIALAPQFDDNLLKFQFAMLATQIVAHEGIAASDGTVDQIADDLTYPPRVTLLAACQGAAIRGQGEFGWLSVVKALSDQGHGRAALGLLFDAVDLHLAKPNSIRTLLYSEDTLALPPLLLRGLLTAVSGAHYVWLPERARHIEQLLLAKYKPND